MNAPPNLFDAGLLAQRRMRAERQGAADFLHEAAAADVAERLSEVNRVFTAPALVTPRPAIWRAALEGAGLAPLIAPDRDPLPLEVGAHDLVVHGLGLHWANDPVGQLVQARRALRPDGLFLGVLFGGQTLAELRQALAEAEVEILGGLSPRVAPMAEIADLGALLQRAGFALPVADAYRIEVTYATAFHLMRDLRAMGETNVLCERHRRVAPRRLFLRAADIYADRFPAPGGRISASFELVFLTGWAPGPGQQQPLRPGSARARLAEALGVEERPAGDRAGGGFDARRG